MLSSYLEIYVELNNTVNKQCRTKIANWANKQRMYDSTYVLLNIHHKYVMFI